MVDLGHEQNNQIGMKEMATIRDIAKITGFSITTVSRVINGHPYVDEQTVR